MINDLMGQPAVVLQDVVVLGAAGLCDFLGHGQDLTQLIVRDVGQLGAVVFGDDELFIWISGLV